MRTREDEDNAERPANSEDPLADAPEPGRDPRLKIPDVLLRPVEKPESLRKQEARAAAARHEALSGKAGWGDMAKAFALGADFVGSVLAGLLLGWLFDRWRGTAPTGTMVGLALGFLAAIVRIMRYAMRAEREAERTRRAARGK